MCAHNHATLVLPSRCYSVPNWVRRSNEALMMAFPCKTLKEGKHNTAQQEASLIVAEFANQEDRWETTRPHMENSGYNVLKQKPAAQPKM